MGGLDVVVSNVADDEVTQDAVLKHAEVVEQLLGRSRAVLPARFDRPLADEEELNTAVSAAARELERGLRRVRGCVELGLRVIAPSAEAVPKGGCWTSSTRRSPVSPRRLPLPAAPVVTRSWLPTSSRPGTCPPSARRSTRSRRHTPS